MNEVETVQIKKYVVIVAGGKGLRMGGDLPKQFIPVKDKPLLMHTLEAFHRWDASAEILLVLPEDHQSYWAMLCREIGCQVPHEIVNGGETRFHSVSNGLKRIASLQAGKDSQRPGEKGPESFYIAVHDGVRPFITPRLITACFDEAMRSGTAVPVVPVIDSLRETEGEDSHPVDRNRYFAVQTPQVFDGNLLLRAYAQPYSPLFTDDASVVEAAGGKIHLVNGERENIKITTRFDLWVAEVMFRYVVQPE